MTTRIRLQEAFKFALSMVLMYWLALWMDWDLARYGALAIVLISLSTSGASISKGVMRVIGTTIAVVVGLILVACFSQERWSMMFALASYLIFTSYFMQNSRYPYAWYVAGFVPLVIWSDTYGAVDNSFHFAIFRWLETVSGVLIYSIVSVLLWPQTSGEQFYRQGGELLDQLCRLLRLNQDALCGIKNNDSPVLQRKLSALSTQLQTTLGTAAIDTVMIKEQKHKWQQALTTLRTLTDNLALLQTTNESLLKRNPEHSQANLGHTLDIIEQRCARIGELWRARQLVGEASQGDDIPLLQTVSLDLSLPRTMSNVERGLLITQANQLRQLDLQSQNLLTLLRVLTGLDSSAELPDQLQHLPPDQPLRWDTIRMLKSLVPAFAFILGFLFWIFPSNPPPGGPSIPEMSGIFGLIVALGVNVRYIGLAFAAAGLLVIGPIYFVVMPWLDGGIGLLTMIFLLSFTFDYLGGRWPMVKTSVMLLFVMSTGISNEQSYSFMGWMSTEFMMITAGIIVNTVVMFMIVLRPEKIMPRKFQGFFHACAAVTHGFVNVTKKKSKSEHFMREIKRVPGELRGVEATIDYSYFPAHAQPKVSHLLDSIDSIAARLRVLETLIKRVAANGSADPLGTELPRRLERLFERWANLTIATCTSKDERDAIEALYLELEKRLEVYNTESETPSYNEQMAIDLASMLAGVRGLLDAMAEMDRSICDIHWNKWAEVHF